MFSTAPRADQPRRILTAEVEDRILRVVQEDPTTSTRRVGAQLHISHRDVWSVVHNEGMYPYHTLQVQELRPGDAAKRLDFCTLMIDNLDTDNNYFNNVLWSDECTFTRAGFFNTHNDHTWATENPRVFKVTKTQYTFKVNVWAGIVGHRLIGPHIFDGNLNSAQYLDFLKNVLPVLLEDVDLATRRNLVFQQDGAPPHSTNAVKDWLNTTFRQPWIGRNGPIPWPPRSPDLTPMDFYLWGHFKQEVYSVPIETREQLIERIHLAAQTIQTRMENINIIGETERRMNICVRQNGAHFENVLK